MGHKSSARDELLQHCLQLGVTFARTLLAILELNPALVEAIEHLRAGRRVLHALRREQSLPGVTGNGFHADRPAQDFSECCGDLIWSDASRSFEFDDTAARPCLLQERSR